MILKLSKKILQKHIHFQTGKITYDKQTVIKYFIIIVKACKGAEAL